MRYRYLIYESPELIATTIETDEPLPHLLVGHQILLSTDDYQEKIGTVLIVEYIRVCISRRKGSFQRYDVHVFCREQESPPPL